MANEYLANYPLLARMWEYLPMCAAVYAASDLRLLEANPLFLQVIDPYLDSRWRQGRIIGQSLTEWGAWAKASGLVDIFYQVAHLAGLTRTGVFNARHWQATPLIGTGP